MIDRAVLDRHGVTEDEYARIISLLGREPNLTELGIFSVMWSEHCSYKSSRVHLKTLPTSGARVLQGATAGITRDFSSRTEAERQLPETQLVSFGPGFAVKLRLQSCWGKSISPAIDELQGPGFLLREKYPQ